MSKDLQQWIRRVEHIGVIKSLTSSLKDTHANFRNTWFNWIEINDYWQLNRVDVMTMLKVVC